MGIRRLFDGEVRVDYGQFYVLSGFGWSSDDLHGCFSGQVNGLCGVGLPGGMWLTTGLHMGDVGLVVELHDRQPVLNDEWDEIVEVSFRVDLPVAVEQWGGTGSFPLAIEAGDYRVRYCTLGMEAGRAADVRMDDDPQVDRYLLQFWLGPPAPDRVIKQSGPQAAHWHGFARDLPPPPTPEEKAEAEHRAGLQRERLAEEARALAEEARLQAEMRAWGGQLPSERLRQVRGNALALAQLNRIFADALAKADPRTQREVARWVTRRAFVEARLADIDWIAPALAAMDRGEPLPAPFDSANRVDRRAWDLLFSDERVPSTLVASLDGRHENCLQQAMAFPAMFTASEPNPLDAALEALWHAAAAFGRGRTQELCDEVRRAFPVIAELGG